MHSVVQPSFWLNCAAHISCRKGRRHQTFGRTINLAQDMRQQLARVYYKVHTYLPVLPPRLEVGDPARDSRKGVFRYFGCDRTGPQRSHRRAHGPVTCLSPKDGTGLRGSPATGGGTSARATDQPKSNSKKYGPAYCALTRDSDCNNYAVACMCPFPAHVPKL